MHHHYGKRYTSHPNALKDIPWRTPVVSTALYGIMQSFSATLKFDPHFAHLMG